MHGSSSGEPMTGVDRAWLEMDEPHNPMIVSGVIEFENVHDLRRLAATIVERLLRYPRFRQRADIHGGPSRWVTCTDLHLDYHVRLRKLAGADVDAELHRAIAAELSEELDRGLPLWRITFFPIGLDRAVALFRAHHAVADGIALMKVLLHLADGSQSVPTATDDQCEVHPHHNGPLSGLIHKLEIANSALEKIGDAVIEEMRHPRDALRQLRKGQQAAAAILHLLLLPKDNPQRLRAELSGRRVCAWDCSRQLAPIKRFAKRKGIKVNDVFLAALAGAFRNYLLSLGGNPVELHNLRVSIPVNLRAPDDESLGNQFGLVMLDLPIDVDRADQRLALVSERMGELKHSPEARAMLACLGAAGHLPLTVEKNLVNFLTARTATVVSNLPGPAEPIFIAGARIGRLVFWPPQAGGVGIGISLISYAGNVSFGVSADQQLIGEPQRLIDAFNRELDGYLKLRRKPPASHGGKPAIESRKLAAPHNKKKTPELSTAALPADVES
jgi:WS/DGAT/MGAT family acyltransferase